MAFLSYHTNILKGDDTLCKEWCKQVEHVGRQLCITEICPKVFPETHRAVSAVLEEHHVASTARPKLGPDVMEAMPPQPPPVKRNTTLTGLGLFYCENYCQKGVAAMDRHTCTTEDCAAMLVEAHKAGPKVLEKPVKRDTLPLPIDSEDSDSICKPWCKSLEDIDEDDCITEVCPKLLAEGKMPVPEVLEQPRDHIGHLASTAGLKLGSDVVEAMPLLVERNTTLTPLGFYFCEIFCKRVADMSRHTCITEYCAEMLEKEQMDLIKGSPPPTPLVKRWDEEYYEEHPEDRPDEVEVEVEEEEEEEEEEQEEEEASTTTDIRSSTTSTPSITNATTTMTGTIMTTVTTHTTVQQSSTVPTPSSTAPTPSGPSGIIATEAPTTMSTSTTPAKPTPTLDRWWKPEPWDKNDRKVMATECERRTAQGEKIWWPLENPCALIMGMSPSSIECAQCNYRGDCKSTDCAKLNGNGDHNDDCTRKWDGPHRSEVYEEDPECGQVEDDA